MSFLQLDKDVYYEDIYTAIDNNDRTTFRELYLKLHDRDQHELFDSLYPEKKQKIAEFLTPQEFSEVFEWMDVEAQELVVQSLSNEYVAEMFNHIANDNLVEYLTQSDSDQEALLAMMDSEESRRVRELLSYAEDTAGSIMTKEYIAINHEQTIDEVMVQLREVGHDAETIYYLYVVNDENHLVGVLSLRDLLLAEKSDIVKDIMSTHVVSARIDQDQEDVAKIIQDYDLLAIPVLSHDSRMQGIVTVDDIIDVIEEEAVEDFIEFAAIKPDDSDDKEVTALRAAKQRTPWILILLILGLLTSGVIGYFEHTLESVVVLAAFIPMIMGTAGNIGTQALAVTVKNISDNNVSSQPILQTVREELVSGSIIGIILALILAIVSLILYQNLALMVIVSLSMVLVSIMSAVVGTTIPILFDKFNIDPAVASGPFITTINDIFGLVVYFMIATSLLQYL